MDSCNLSLKVSLIVSIFQGRQLYVKLFVEGFGLRVVRLVEFFKTSLILCKFTPLSNCRDKEVWELLVGIEECSVNHLLALLSLLLAEGFFASLLPFVFILVLFVVVSYVLDRPRVTLILVMQITNVCLPHIASSHCVSATVLFSHFDLVLKLSVGYLLD